MVYSVYKHTVPNGKVYIGATCQKTKNRWGVNGSNYKSNPLFYEDILKYGWDNIKHEILHTVFTREDAYYLEKNEIKAHNSMNPEFGYNRNPGSRLSVSATIILKENGDSEKGETGSLLTIESMAHELGVSKRYIHGLILDGMPKIRIGTLIRFDRKEVSNWLKHGRTAEYYAKQDN